MCSFRYLLFFIPLILTSNSILLNAQVISIDEDFTDWESVSSFSQESNGDDGTGEIDILDIKVSSDSDYLYFYINTAQEFLLQDNDGITLLIDTDNDPNTGKKYAGLGYELLFNLGQRYGEFQNTTLLNINSYDIGLVSAPTVSSDTFEFKIDRNIKLNGDSLFPADSIKFLFRTQESNGDIVPDNSSNSAYEFSNTPFQAPHYTLQKFNASDTRVLSYNVLRDNLFDSNLNGEFKRIFKAIEPDIIGLQEVYDHSAEEAANLINDFLPGKTDENWYHGDVGNDNLIVSRFPVTNQKAIDGNAAYLLDLNTTQLLVIVAHPPCCTNDDGRQAEFDAIMRFLRDSKSGLEFDLAKGTPIIIIGDMNLVGQNRQVRTLLAGDISDENRFGADFNPDWDETALEDAKPQNPNSPTTFTWFSEGSSFSAGRLDYIVYSGSVWELQNSFSLYTPILPQDTLAANGLERDDSIIASDHLPLVADFRPKVTTSTPEPLRVPKEIELFYNFPNPFNPTTTVEYELPSQGMATIEIFSIDGRKVATLVQEVQSAGIHSVQWNAENKPSGLYFMRLQSGGEIDTQKMMLLK